MTHHSFQLGPSFFKQMFNPCVESNTVFVQKCKAEIYYADPPHQTHFIDGVSHQTLSRKQRSSVHFPSAFMCNTGPSLALQELINLFTICSFLALPCPSLPASQPHRERRKAKETHKVQSNTPEDFSPTEWAYCEAAQTVVCVPAKFPRGAEETQ